ncbi:MAG: metallopeptidase TldD-related protein [Candidatus Woesearchaeota archaeon]
MINTELVRSEKELENIADLMSSELVNSGENIISRYVRVFFDMKTFINGQSSEHRYTNSNFNKEDMRRGIYSLVTIDDLLLHNYKDICVARDLQDHRFHFASKEIPLPVVTESRIDNMPLDADMYDDELREFTESHPNSRLKRTLSVQQKIVVNSGGGITIQSIPFLGISYSHGYNPIPTSRDINVVCSDDEVKRFPELIRFIADPTPEGRIRNAQSFTDAFHELYGISGLKYGSLENAGIPLSELYDVVMLTGVPVHEIFGHHFEEPIRFLDFGESATFKYGQNITNRNIILSDNPNQSIAGFRPLGFSYFDAYGRKTQERVHIKDGHVVGFLGSEYADPDKFKQFLNLEKSEYSGNAVQDSDGMFPQPRMSCTVIDGKTENVDLEGKILVVSHEGHTQPQDKTYNVKAYECYVVRDGVPRRIIPLQVTGGINQALANIALLENQSYQTGVCGKPEPIYYPQSRGSAQVPVSQFAKDQLWKNQQVYPLPISDNHLKVLHKKK